MTINVTRSSMPPFEEYTEEIKDIWQSHWLTNMGVKHQKLQAELKEYLGVENIDLLTNGHMALELSMQALNLRGEVITTPFTFASTTQAIVRNGLTPVFCDINPVDFTIDVNKFERLITDKTCAIVPVHVYGNICDVEKIENLAQKYELKVLYDAAHTFGVKYKGKGIGSFGDVSCFSFHATKVFNSIEGGAVCYKDEKFGERLRYLKNFGIASAEDVELKLTYAGNLSSLKGAIEQQNFKFVKDDIADRDFVYSLFEAEKPDIVVNFAAESHVDRSILEPELFLKTNVIGTGVLMDACRKYGIKRYHQVSTDEVYGDLPLDRPDLFFTETTPLHTSSPYSASKASADLLVLAYHRTYGLPVTISRCSNNYGPYHFPEKLIPLMIINALHDKELPVYGDGANVRDWLYVEDHCRAIDLIIRNGREGEVYNVGGHNEKSNLDVVKIILKALGKSEDLITFVKDRPGHDRRYAIDPTKIHNELGWLPQTKFEDGIAKTIEWYLANKDWWQEIISGEYQKYYEKMYKNR